MYVGTTGVYVWKIITASFYNKCFEQSQLHLILHSFTVYANGLLCYTCSWAPSKFLTGISTLQDPVADIYLGLNNINCRDNFNPVGISKINCTEFFGPAVCVKAISQAGGKWTRRILPRHFVILDKGHRTVKINAWNWNIISWWLQAKQIEHCTKTLYMTWQNIVTLTKQVRPHQKHTCIFKCCVIVSCISSLFFAYIDSNTQEWTFWTKFHILPFTKI